jgi:hypothetical protein
VLRKVASTAVSTSMAAQTRTRCIPGGYAPCSTRTHDAVALSSIMCIF